MAPTEEMTLGQAAAAVLAFVIVLWLLTVAVTGIVCVAIRLSQMTVDLVF